MCAHRRGWLWLVSGNWLEEVVACGCLPLPHLLHQASSWRKPSQPARRPIGLSMSSRSAASRCPTYQSSRACHWRLFLSGIPHGSPTRVVPLLVSLEGRYPIGCVMSWGFTPASIRLSRHVTQDRAGHYPFLLRALIPSQMLQLFCSSLPSRLGRPCCCPTQESVNPPLL
jgi:hypothetical protein